MCETEIRDAIPRVDSKRGLGASRASTRQSARRTNGDRIVYSRTWRRDMKTDLKLDVQWSEAREVGGVAE
jgi:hypothetical protein